MHVEADDIRRALERGTGVWPVSSRQAAAVAEALAARTTVCGPAAPEKLPASEAAEFALAGC